MADNIKEKIQDRVIDCIALNGQGRLVAFKPENSDKDLVVEKRSDYKKKTIALDICQRKFADSRDLLQQISQAQNFIPAKDFYLVFVYFDLVTQKVNDIFWVIPSLDLASVSEKNFNGYLVEQKDFAGFLIDVLEDSKYKKIKK
jgi:hypothetical protein